VKVPGHYRSAPPQAARVGMSAVHHCSGPCGVHSHQHDFARTSEMPVSDDNAFWGALGCSCFAF
ncbi:amidohydrolase, partial [Enterobacter asburiae]